MYDVFAAAEDTEKQIGLARELLLDKGDFEYYSVLKALLTTQKCWEKEYPQLIVELADCIPIERYMAILSEENEKALLLEQISKKPLCVFTYAKKLAKQYPSEVFSLCTDAIHSRGRNCQHEGDVPTGMQRHQKTGLLRRQRRGPGNHSGAERKEPETPCFFGRTAIYICKAVTAQKGVYYEAR